MTALGKLIRTTAFKLLAAYLFIFALFAGSVIAYLGWHTQRLVTRQAVEAIEADTRFMQAQFERGGINRLVNLVNRRAGAPDAGLLLVTSFNGDPLAGNMMNLPLNFLDKQGWREIDYVRTDDSAAPPSRALVHVVFLPGEYRLLIGRDVVEREELRQIIIGPAVWGLALLVVLGMAGGLFITRRVLKRIDQMTAISDGIMAGDLSGRLAVSGTGDEFDRLALSLNAMLDRIEALMAGLKQVSDNIAHDLKTPLTRLRNRAEEALRTAQSPDELRAALDGAIEEADNLIRVFNALLMIARLEAGRASENMGELDLSEIVSGLAELYEPLAEEAELTLTCEVAPGLKVQGNRELIGQALNNLIDNALKYGAPEQGGDGTVAVSARQIGDQVELSVADHGPGIPEVDRGRVLDRFVRLDASRSKPGFGLGLSLVAGVVRLHGGQLRLEDNAPGLRVVILLPAGSPKPVDTPALAEPAASTAAPNPAGLPSL